MKQHISVIFAYLVVAMGCDDQNCTPGSTQTCVCAGGAPGGQTCNSSGSGWGDCDCGEADSSTDADVEDTEYDGPCRGDDDCDDGLFCNGVETCDSGDCVAGTVVTCDDSDDCTTDTCDETSGECEYVARDEDGDGFIDVNCGGDDCDDERDDAYPGSVAVGCGDGIDQDCDGMTDEMTVRFLDEGDDVDADLSHELVWTGSNFGMLYRTRANTFASFAMLDEDGVTVAGPVHVYDDTTLSSPPELTWTGSEFGVFWADGGVSSEVMQRISATGTLVGPANPLWDLIGGTCQPVWTDDNYVLLCGNLMVALEVSPLGVAGTATSTSLPPTAEFWTMAWSGSQIGLLWSNVDFVNFTRLGSDGVPVSTDVQLFTGSSAAMPAVDLLWTGTGWAAGWTLDDEMHVDLISADGSTVVPSTAVTGLTDPCETIDLAWTGSEVWAATDDTTGEYGSRITITSVDGAGTASGVNLPVLDVLDPEYTVHTPRIVWTGSELGLSSFSQEMGIPAGVYFALVGPCH